MQVLFRESPRVVRAYGLKHVLHRQRPSLILPRQDRTAVQKQAGNVQARQGHGPARDRFVASGDGDKAVKQMSASHELDGIGNYLAADQRGLHPFRAHGDAVSHRDRVEFYGCAARCPDALFYLECQVPVVVIAWRNLDPAMRDADYRAAQVLVGESDRLEVAPGWSPIRPIQQNATPTPWIVNHRPSSGIDD